MRTLFSYIFLLLLFSGCLSDEHIGIDPDSGAPAGQELPQDRTPVVKFESTYPVQFLDGDSHPGLVYGQGLSHDGWNGSNTVTQDLKLDLFLPEGAPGNRPALILIHGGGYFGGSRKHNALQEIARYFVRRGWVAVSIDYRLAGDFGTIPSQWDDYVLNHIASPSRSQVRAIYPAVRDAKAAVRWLYAHAEEYQINTDYITIGGGSAGAFSSIAVANTEPEDYRDEISGDLDPTLASTYPDQPSRVRAILDYWGGPAAMSALDEVYGLQRFDSSDVPILIIHGVEDTVVPFSEAESLRDTYTLNGVPFDFLPLIGEGHSAWGTNVEGKTIAQLSWDFVVEQLGLVVD